jgi:hypothetical protein
MYKLLIKMSNSKNSTYAEKTAKYVAVLFKFLGNYNAKNIRLLDTTIPSQEKIVFPEELAGIADYMKIKVDSNKIMFSALKAVKLSTAPDFVHYLNGMILRIVKGKGWQILATQAAPVHTGNIPAVEYTKIMNNKAKYHCHPVIDGTQVTVYFEDGARKIATATSMDVSKYKWMGPLTYSEILDECMGDSFDASEYTISQYCISHPNFHLSATAPTYQRIAKWQLNTERTALKRIELPADVVTADKVKAIGSTFGWVIESNNFTGPRFLIETPAMGELRKFYSINANLQPKLDHVTRRIFYELRRVFKPNFTFMKVNEKYLALVSLLTDKYFEMEDQTVISPIPFESEEQKKMFESCMTVLSTSSHQVGAGSPDRVSILHDMMATDTILLAFAKQLVG